MASPRAPASRPHWTEFPPKALCRQLGGQETAKSSKIKLYNKRVHESVVQTTLFTQIPVRSSLRRFDHVLELHEAVVSRHRILGVNLREQKVRDWRAADELSHLVVDIHHRARRHGCD